MCFALGVNVDIIGAQHIAEQATLFERIVERDVRVGARIEPGFWH